MFLHLALYLSQLLDMHARDWFVVLIVTIAVIIAAAALQRLMNLCLIHNVHDTGLWTDHLCFSRT